MKSKTTIIALFVALFVSPLFAKADILSGRSYCRTVISDGSFGQPKGERKHCITFKNGVASDSSNTFFGKGPEYAKYTLVGNTVKFAKSEYLLSEDNMQLKTVKGSTVAGVIFDLQVICAQFMPPAPGWCKDGKIVSGGFDRRGCQLPPTCVRP